MAIKAVRKMTCPHCGIDFNPTWCWGVITHDPYDDDIGWGWRLTRCPGHACGNIIIRAGGFQHEYDEVGERNSTPAWNSDQDYLVWPKAVQRIPLGDEVPDHIKTDYREACAVLSISAKASAAFSRRILEAILKQQGYEKNRLQKKIADAISEEKYPPYIRDTLDTVRKFGNLSAHSPAEYPTDKIVDVEPEEADWCLKAIEQLIKHCYVKTQTAETNSAMSQRADQLTQNRKPNSSP